jgi:hypothetical protein
MGFLTVEACIRFLGRMVLSIVIYFAYGRSPSRLDHSEAAGWSTEGTRTPPRERDHGPVCPSR